MPCTLPSTFAAAINHDGLLDGCRHLLLGVSGGADSVAMARLFHRLPRSQRVLITLAHLHHGIRGREADADARFVRQLARTLQVPVVVEKVDVPALARRKKISIEMAAREARYAFFRRAAHARQADRVATAHTADDQAETILLRLFRGAGPAGLSGIPRQRREGELLVIRPLLNVSRREIEAYLRALRQPWREDSSNRDTRIARNRIRHDVLPLLEQRVNPDVRRILCQTADILREENLWLDALCQKMVAACSSPSVEGGLDVQLIASLPVAAQRRVLRTWLDQQDVDAARLGFPELERLRGLLGPSRGTRSVALGGGCRVVRVYHTLRLQRADAPPRTEWCKSIRVPGTTRLDAQRLIVRTRKGPGITKHVGARLLQFPARATLSARAVGRAGLVIRNWRPGDRMAPLGLRGTKKLQDLFVDRKVPRAERTSVPILECRDEIVWVPGYAVARGWEVRDRSAKNIQVMIEQSPA